MAARGLDLAGILNEDNGAGPHKCNLPKRQCNITFKSFPGRSKIQMSNEGLIYHTYRGEGDATPDRAGIAHHNQEEDGADDSADDVATDEGDDAPNAGEDDDEDEGRLDHELGNLHHDQEHDDGKDQTEDAGHGRGVQVRGPVDRAVGVAKGLLEGGRSVRRNYSTNRANVGIQEEGENRVAAAHLLLAALFEVAAGGGPGLDLGRAMVVWAGYRRALDNDGFRHGGVPVRRITELNKWGG